MNVLLGSESWDIRPLLLSLGKVSLARFSAPLGDNLARSIAADLESVASLSDNQQRVQLLPGEGRFMVLRPYFQETLKDLLESGALPRDISRIELIRNLIARVQELADRNAAHGHISPANIVLRQDGVLLVDPLLGTLHHSSDLFLAPENVKGRSPAQASDIFGLGRTIRTLAREELTQAQESCVEQMLLSDPRSRPAISEVARVFGAGGSSARSAGATGELDHPTKQINSGRVVRNSSSGRAARSDGDHRSFEVLNKGVSKESRPTSIITPIALCLLALSGGVWFIKDRYPALYYELASRIPLVAPQHSAEYESNWASRNRVEMASVGRAAAIRREPSAINTILNDLLSGSNPDYVNGALLRVAFADAWREDLTPIDKHAALVFALEQLVPEGRSQISGVRDLHPGVLLALLGQGGAKGLSPEFKQMPIEIMTRLPEPFGSLFAQVKAMGAVNLGDPAVSGLAEIVTGNARAEAFRRFLGEESDPAKLLARVALVRPAVSVNEAAAAELLSALAEKGGELSSLIGWFDLLDLAGWAKAKSVDKLSLIMGDLPESGINTARLSDLLSFPLDQVRQSAIVKLREGFKGQDVERLLVTLAVPGTGLTREQTISLLSALKLPAESRVPFIAAWFNLNPPAEGVLLILLARSSYDSSDVFNLEAARYLRKASWSPSLDVLKLLAKHPEPLARALAYGRLDPMVDSDRSVLLERQRDEKDENCLKIIKERLASYKKETP